MGGNPVQAEQMNPILPLLLLDDGADNDNTKALMMMMMMNQNALGDTNAILPLLLLNDDDNDGDKDMTSLFLLSAIMHLVFKQFFHLCFWTTQLKMITYS